MNIINPESCLKKKEKKRLSHASVWRARDFRRALLRLGRDGDRIGGHPSFRFGISCRAFPSMFTDLHDFSTCHLLNSDKSRALNRIILGQSTRGYKLNILKHPRREDFTEAWCTAALSSLYLTKSYYHQEQSTLFVYKTLFFFKDPSLFSYFHLFKFE